MNTEKLYALLQLANNRICEQCIELGESSDEVCERCEWFRPFNTGESIETKVDEEDHDTYSIVTTQYSLYCVVKDRIVAKLIIEPKNATEEYGTFIKKENEEYSNIEEFLRIEGITLLPKEWDAMEPGDFIET